MSLLCELIVIGRARMLLILKPETLAIASWRITNPKLKASPCSLLKRERIPRSNMTIFIFNFYATKSLQIKKQRSNILYI